MMITTARFVNATREVTHFSTNSGFVQRTKLAKLAGWGLHGWSASRVVRIKER